MPEKFWDSESGEVIERIFGEPVALYKHGQLYWEMRKENGELYTGFVMESEFENVFKPEYERDDFMEISNEKMLELVQELE